MHVRYRPCPKLFALERTLKISVRASRNRCAFCKPSVLCPPGGAVQCQGYLRKLQPGFFLVQLDPMRHALASTPSLHCLHLHGPAIAV